MSSPATSNAAARRLLAKPGEIARSAFARLPVETQTHGRAAATEGIAAARALADGATDLTERVIDRVSALLGGPRAPEK